MKFTDETRRKLAKRGIASWKDDRPLLAHQARGPELNSVSGIHVYNFDTVWARKTMGSVSKMGPVYLFLSFVQKDSEQFDIESLWLGINCSMDDHLQ